MKIKIFNQKGELIEEFEGEIQPIESSQVHYPGYDAKIIQAHSVLPPIIEYKIVKLEG